MNSGPMSSGGASGSTPGWAGGSFGERAQCVLAPNANMMTLDGTNTWVLREPDARRSIVIDPGPSILSHLDAIESASGAVAAVLLTHHHHDHSEAAREFAERMGCGVRALDPAYQLGSEGLGDGDVVEVDGLEVHVIATPGHTADSLSFHVPADGAVLTGDTVLGRGTTVVAHPDGQLGAYLDSLDRLHRLASEHELAAIWPGHGPVIEDALGALDFYISHRRDRLAQVEAAVATLAAQTPGGQSPASQSPGGQSPASQSPGGQSPASQSPGGQSPGSQSAPDGSADDLPRKVVEIVYADVDPVLWGAAELSVRAQLAFLQR